MLMHMPRSRAPSQPSVGQIRLLAHRLVEGGRTTAAQAVRSMLAMQAQDLESALWSVGLRAPGVRRKDVVQALAAGTIVRSWPLRGTLHITAAEDLPWLLSTLSSRMVDATAKRREALGLDDRALGRARDIAIEHLSGGRALSREDMLAAFVKGGVAVDSHRGYHLLFNLSLTGTLCFGPPGPKEQTFVLLSEWVKKPRRLDRDEALGEIARRYFESHGPATLSDLVGWARITAADAKRGVAIAGKSVVPVALDGATYLMGAPRREIVAPAASNAKSSVLALPGFDEYVLGYKNRDAVLDRAFAERIVPGGNGVFRPTIVVSGQVRGVWRRTKLARTVAITCEGFTQLSRETLRGFARAAEAYGSFLETVVRLSK